MPLTNVTLAPGQFYLVAQACNANGVNTLPAADATSTIAMSATAAKVAAVSSTTALNGSGGNLVDLVGYGGGVSFYWYGSGSQHDESGANGTFAPSCAMAKAVCRI